RSTARSCSRRSSPASGSPEPAATSSATRAPACGRPTGSCATRSLRPGHLGSRGLHSADDALVAGAAAQVARKRDPDLVLAGSGVAVEQRLRRDQHARRAEAALHPALGEELALERVQLLVFGQALD